MGVGGPRRGGMAGKDIGSDMRARNRTRVANVSLCADDAIRRRPPVPGAIRGQGGEAAMLARHRQWLIREAGGSGGSARVSARPLRGRVAEMTTRRDLEVPADSHVRN